MTDRGDRYIQAAKNDKNRALLVRYLTDRLIKAIKENPGVSAQHPDILELAEKLEEALKPPSV